MDTKPQYFMCLNFRSLEAKKIAAEKKKKKIAADIWQK